MPLCSSEHTTLYVAAAKGHINGCRVMVGAGVEFDFNHVGNDIAVFTAACKGYVDIVGYMLSRGAFAWPRSKTSA
jgi:hypothetical protein